MIDEGSVRYREALRRGHVAVARGRPREAMAHYEEAARLAESRALPLVCMGSLHLRSNQPREAIRAFDEALERAPGDLGAMHGKAAALQAEGRLEESRALARRTAELEAMERAGRPEPGDADERRQRLEGLIAEGLQARAAGELDRAASAFHAAALGYAAAAGFEAAIDACLRALEARPGAIDVHFTMAHLYLSRGWADLGVQRVRLIDHRLGIDEDPRRRAALQALARDFRALDPALEEMATLRA
jgi:tetratricopeptide (TPR) repeat protein